MGTCDIIPGVSGGTIALITGIYERLITAIGNIRPAIVVPLLKGDFKSFEKELERIDFVFLLFLVGGIGLAVITFARIILYLLEVYPGLTYSFFFGLIVASSVLIFLEIEYEARTIKAGLFLICGIIAGFVIAGLNPASLGHSLPVLFFTGMIAICAMILPGISGAYITLLMNQYEYLLAALKAVSLPEIISYIAGGLIGLLMFSKVLKYLLKNHQVSMLSFLTGLMLGSVRMLFNKIESAGGFDLSVIFLFISGILVIVAMEWIKRKYDGKFRV
ncbi:DUF368 domain-containing protein [Methanoplanus sp. FWC-SCC4]|uniref:DUF368 domain-containing protein n=2 Tax=Methanochimaera problematica TaxID=2609417 RepID=A0AA97FG24_9EURY|nr:DUF368 domain-containing protein [Methanoplanus sp. FWC-SCC4]